MKNFRFTLIIAAALGLASCGGNVRQGQPSEPMAASGRTQATENLLASMKRLAGEGKSMFGHQESTSYGVGWVAVSDTSGTRSDVKSVCGDMPAVLGFDLGHLELGDSLNIDGVPFSSIRRDILAHADRGGMVTLSWHAANPLNGRSAWVADSLRQQESQTVASILEGGSKHELFLGWLDRVATFLNSLQDDYGRRVPVVFRPWHEHTGSWFWWGKELCTAEQYSSLWQLTVSRLKAQGVVNALYAYSPGSLGPDATTADYMERYPGDDIVDIIGLDQYCRAEAGDTAALRAYADELHHNLGVLCQAAADRQKVAALTETGYEGLKAPSWWTDVLAPVLHRHPLAYVLVWRNAHSLPGHFFAPYPGQPSATDFVRFYNLPETLFLGDVNALYLGSIDYRL